MIIGSCAAVVVGDTVLCDAIGLCEAVLGAHFNGDVP